MRVLGVPQFRRIDGSLVRIAERRHQALLVFLALHPGAPVSRDRLVDLFWPNAAAGAGRASLRQALSTLRRALGPEVAALVLATRDTVALQASGVQTDLGLLHERSAEGLPAEVTLLEGLTGFSTDFDAWRAAEQAAVSDLLRQRLGALAEEAAGRRQFGVAARLLGQALQIDPFDEAAHRRMMALHAAQGRHAEALRHYERLRAMLQEELAEAPEQATQDLARSIRAKRQERGRADAGAGPSSSHPPGLAGRAPPPTRYARSGRHNIAYQVTGEGPVDLILVQGWVSHLDFAWTHPAIVQFLDRLGSIARLIRFDKRGTGLSDRDVGLPDLTERMEDLVAVMDAAGSRRAVLLGTSEGGALTMLCASAYPDRIAGLVLYGAYARGLWAEDYPWAKTPAQLEAELAALAREWGGPFDLGNGAPSLDGNAAERDWFAAFSRAAASLQDAVVLWRWGAETDLRDMLSAIRVPTLVLHRSGDRWVKVEEGRYLAERIPGASYAEFQGVDHLIWAGDNRAILDAVARFIEDLGAREV